jgi:hypothetical protein
VEIARRRSDFPTRSEPRAFGQVEALLETDEAGLYLVHVRPDQKLALELPGAVRMMQWLVDGEMRRGGPRCCAGDPWGVPRSGSVPDAMSGPQGAVLFWCTYPAWLPG